MDFKSYKVDFVTVTGNGTFTLRARSMKTAVSIAAEKIGHIGEIERLSVQVYEPVK